MGESGGGGGQGAGELRELTWGTGKCLPGGPTSNQDSWVSATKLQDFRTASYQLAKLTSDCKTADCKTTLTYIDCMLLVITSYASQPGGPERAGGFPK